MSRASKGFYTVPVDFLHKSVLYRPTRAYRKIKSWKVFHTVLVGYPPRFTRLGANIKNLINKIKLNYAYLGTLKNGF